MNIRRMFFGGNTSSGFYSFHNYIVNENRKRLYILKGMPGGGKSTLMKKIGEHLSKEGYTVEFHHCPTDSKSLDSIFILELNIAIVDGTAPHIMDPIYPGLKDEIIDLAKFIDKEKLRLHEDEIIKAQKLNKRAYFNVFSYLKSARYIHDIIVEKNKEGVDIDKLNKKTRFLIEDLFSKKEIEVENIIFKERHAFSKANSSQGLVDYTDTILNGVKDIYYIEGEIGIGKSTLIKKIYNQSKIRDYSIEVYHDSTFPEKMETLIIKELNCCVTSNEKGKYYATSIIDLDEYFDDSVIDKKDYELYNSLIEKAIYNLKEAKKLHDVIEKKYIPTIDYEQIDRVREDLLEEILSLV